MNSLYNVIANSLACRFIKIAIVAIEVQSFSIRNTLHNILDLIMSKMEVDS